MEMSDIPKDFPIIDIEPLIIKKFVDDEFESKWTHEYIETWYKEYDPLKLDPEIHRMTFEKDNVKVVFYFKSQYVINCLIQRDQEGNVKGIDSYVNVPAVATYITDGILSDAYTPLPKLEMNIDTAKDYIKIKEEYPSEVLISTDFGKSISNIDESWIISDFGVLVGIAKLSDDESYVLDCAI